MQKFSEKILKNVATNLGPILSCLRNRCYLMRDAVIGLISEGEYICLKCKADKSCVPIQVGGLNGSEERNNN